MGVGGLLTSSSGFDGVGDFVITNDVARFAGGFVIGDTCNSETEIVTESDGSISINIGSSTC